MIYSRLRGIIGVNMNNKKYICDEGKLFLTTFKQDYYICGTQEPSTLLVYRKDKEAIKGVDKMMNNLIYDAISLMYNVDLETAKNEYKYIPSLAMKDKCVVVKVRKKVLQKDGVIRKILNRFKVKDL